jgi:hypothetical protein
MSEISLLNAWLLWMYSWREWPVSGRSLAELPGALSMSETSVRRVLPG